MCSKKQIPFDVNKCIGRAEEAHGHTMLENTGESLNGCNSLTSIGNVQGGVEYVQTPLSSEQSSNRASVSAWLILP